ncbi:MAG: efflux RND transporter periplasmic adaptor subunit [Planctomycetota bacterium]|nr:efflux RND transporter periplasmic adaptor subunit [Planctomycetota bacterium]
MIAKLALIAVALAATASAKAPAPPASTEAYAEEVFTQPSKAIELAAAVGGIIKTVGADEGSVVKAGDVILALDDSTEELACRAARLEAESDADEQGARATMEQAQEEARITKQLSAEGAEAQLLYLQKKMAYDVALYKYELAKKNRQKAMVDAEATKVALERKKIRAPVAGIVTRKPKGVGEAAQPLETVAHMAVIDPLHIIIHPPARMLGMFKASQTLAVEVLEPRRQSVSTKVQIVNPVVDPASNTFRVRLAVENPDGRISAGVRVRVTVAGPESLK